MHIVEASTLYPTLFHNVRSPSIPDVDDHMYGCYLAEYQDVGDMDNHLDTGLILIYITTLCTHSLYLVGKFC